MLIEKSSKWLSFSIVMYPYLHHSVLRRKITDKVIKDELCAELSVWLLQIKVSELITSNWSPHNFARFVAQQRMFCINKSEGMSTTWRWLRKEWDTAIIWYTEMSLQCPSGVGGGALRWSNLRYSNLAVTVKSWKFQFAGRDQTSGERLGVNWGFLTTFFSKQLLHPESALHHTYSLLAGD